MNQLRSFPLVLDNGERAEVLSTARFLDDRKDWMVRLRNGREFLVPRSALEPLPDGSYRLNIPAEALSERAFSGTPATNGELQTVHHSGDQAETVVPALEEELHVGREQVETGRLRIHKTVETRDALVEENLLSHEYHVERVPVDRLITEPMEPRYEEDTLVLPVFEEVLVVEKRLVLREEIRITRRTSEHVDQQTVPVRREHIDVERV